MTDSPSHAGDFEESPQGTESGGVPRPANRSVATPLHTEEVEIRGHIVDSLILPKILDEIIQRNAEFEFREISIGHHRADPSFARLAISAASEEQLEGVLVAVCQHGAVPVHSRDCKLQPADMAGAFPDGFYCTTNLQTDVRLKGHWVPVGWQEMDCGIRVDPDIPSAECIPMTEVTPGDLIVIGRQGTRVQPQERDRDAVNAFSFMQSTVSSEKPKTGTVREIAAEMLRARTGTGKIIVVAGPAVVHTGSRELFSRMIREGYVNVLFAGNALATHDIEQSWFGTSLGISIERGISTEEGHEHHLRSINRVRRLGGIRPAVEQGALTSGIMYECVKNGVDYVLGGSIRDDGPLPDVITDTIEAQRTMRQHIPGTTLCLMLATTLHSIAVGNLLPAGVRVVCVDINPATVTKLADRGSFQTIGLVTDVEPFLRVLVTELETQAAAKSL